MGEFGYVCELVVVICICEELSPVCVSTVIVHGLCVFVHVCDCVGTVYECGSCACGCVCVSCLCVCVLCVLAQGLWVACSTFWWMFHSHPFYYDPGQTTFMPVTAS